MLHHLYSAYNTSYQFLMFQLFQHEMPVYLFIDMTQNE